MAKLALLGGEKIVSIKGPHEIRPPKGSDLELEELGLQRNIDIGIRGKSGPIKEFEELFVKFLDNQLKYSVSFNSGTSGLFAAYFAIGIQEGDEIIGPSLTYHAALSPAYVLKANIILCDIDINTRCIDPLKIEALITPKTKAITVVHQWGHPAEMTKILEIANKYNLKVIEDCSHAHGSKIGDQFCGSFGDVAVFSLQTNKMIFAGEGGILVTNNEMIYERATLIGHYRDRCKNEINNFEMQKYRVTGFGMKLRLSPFNAIVAKHSLQAYNERKNGRHKCLSYFNERLKEVDYIEPIVIEDNIDMGAWYGFKPLFKSEKISHLPRNLIIQALKAEGVEAEIPSGGVLSLEPLYNEQIDGLYGRIKKQNGIENLVNAMYVQENAIGFPTFYEPHKDIAIIDQYINALKKIGENVEDLLLY